MNVMTVLKSEISRLARKEAKRVVAPVQKASATYRGLIASLRKQVDALQKEVAGMRRAMPKHDMAIQAPEPQGRFWITGKGVKALRKRLGATQAQLAKLAGVSSQAVVNWEAHKGKINLRKAAAGALQGLRGKGKREVAQMLGETEKAVKTEAKPKVKASPMIREKTKKAAPPKD